MSNKYRFTRNLLRVSSHCVKIEDVKMEWCEIGEEMRNNIDGQCICGRKIKNVKYFYNQSTKHTIGVGSICCKKFGFNPKVGRCSVYNDIFKTIITNREYEIIADIISYSKLMQERLMKHYNSKFVELEKTTFTLDIGNRFESILTEIQSLINDYNVEYMKDLYKSKNNRLLELKNIYDDQKLINDVIMKQYYSKIDTLEKKTFTLEIGDRIKYLLTEIQSMIDEDTVEHMKDLYKSKNNRLLELKNTYYEHSLNEQAVILEKKRKENHSENVWDDNKILEFHNNRKIQNVKVENKITDYYVK